MQHDFNQKINRKGTHCFKYDFRKEYFGKEDVIPMWVADMDLPVPEAVTRALSDRVRHPVYGYSVINDGYFEAFIKWEEKRHNWKIQKEWIQFSPGIVTGLNLLVNALTKPGDKIIIQTPVYFPFFWAVEKNGRQIAYNQLAEKEGVYTMDLEGLEKQLNDGAKMIFLCNPHNPVGRAWTEEELSTIGKMCLEHDAVIISDEIHCDLVLEPNKHIPVARISEELEQQTITCLSPSKTFNLAGLFTSQIVIPDEAYRKAYEKEMEKHHLSPNIFGVVASEAAYRHGTEWLDDLMAHLKGNIDYVTTFLREKIPAVKLVPPEATYLLWLDFRELGIPDKELKKIIIEKAGLGFNEGRMFGPGGHGFQRMNVACPAATVEQAMERLLKTFG